MAKPLRELIADFSSEVIGPSDVLVDDVTIDSRRVKPGSLFVALRGTKEDGHRFISSAIASGARAILCQEPAAVAGATQVIVPDPLRVLAAVSLRLWENPSKQLFMVGITGTNGKTTVSYLIESVLNAAGMKSGVLGTINYRYP